MERFLSNIVGILLDSDIVHYKVEYRNCLRKSLWLVMRRHQLLYIHGTMEKIDGRWLCVLIPARFFSSCKIIAYIYHFTDTFLLISCEGEAFMKKALINFGETVFKMYFNII